MNTTNTNSTIEILDNNRHKELKVDFQAARRSARQGIVPVVLSEFHTLMSHFPLVLVKDSETGEFTCSALLGVNQDANLLDATDVSSEDGLPLNVRRLPLLAVAPSASDNNGPPLVGINMSSAGIGEGDAIFKGQAAAFELAISALGELYEGYEETRMYVKKLVELDLVSKLNAEIRHKDKPVQILEGLYGIDVNKVALLRDRDDKSKSLFFDIASYAYAQNFSLFNMTKLSSLLS